MISRLFGSYLVKEGKLTEEQLKTVFETMQKVRVKLGLIAISEKLMTTEQSDEVNRLQAIMDKRFGDIAVEKGYLTEEQVTRLLGLQGNQYLSFVQAIVDNDFLNMSDIESALCDYQKSYGFTSTDMEALKSGDSDNREGIAARLYWGALFGEDFTRDREESGINALLNYGYDRNA